MKEMDQNHFLKQSIIKKESYRTTIDRKTNHKSIGWGVEAHKIMNNGWGPYGRDSYDQTYANELFLGGRQSSSNAGQKFLPTDRMPILSRGNFNPEFIGVLSHKQNDAKKSKIKVTYQREMVFNRSEILKFIST
ncbi:hypothetical protein SASK131_23040 [Staphylococcus argenteus]